MKLFDEFVVNSNNAQSSPTPAGVSKRLLFYLHSFAGDRRNIDIGDIWMFRGGHTPKFESIYDKHAGEQLSEMDDRFHSQFDSVPSWLLSPALPCVNQKIAARLQVALVHNKLTLILIVQHKAGGNDHQIA